MTTYTLDTHATIREFQEAGMDSRQAEVVVAAISRSDAQLATKADLKAEITAVKSELKQEIATVKSDIKLLKWMVGVILVCVVFPILKSFLA